MMPGEDTVMLHVAEDPDQAWAELGDYFFHEASTYSSWQTEDISSAVHSYATTPEELRAEGIYQVLSPDQVVERVQRVRRRRVREPAPARRRHADRRGLEVLAALRGRSAATRADPADVDHVVAFSRPSTSTTKSIESTSVGGLRQPAHRRLHRHHPSAPHRRELRRCALRRRRATSLTAPRREVRVHGDALHEARVDRKPGLAQPVHHERREQLELERTEPERARRRRRRPWPRPRSAPRRLPTFSGGATAPRARGTPRRRYGGGWPSVSSRWRTSAAVNTGIRLLDRRLHDPVEQLLERLGCGVGDPPQPGDPARPRATRRRSTARLRRPPSARTPAAGRRRRTVGRSAGG